MSNLHDTPPCISGRMPFCGPTWLVNAQAFAYLAIAADDHELTAAFKRLWCRASEKEQAYVLLRQSAGLSWYSPAGLLPIVKQTLGRTVPAERPPQGNWSMPYGALSVQRRGDWMALVKGYGRYVWDVEKHHDQNIYGLFSNYGSISVYGSGTPVTAKASGFVANGWDWRLWPGTTAPFLPYEEFEKHEHVRYFSASSMAGGVSDGRNGVHGLHLLADKYGFKLDAKKTVFMNDDVLVCLGSDIQCTGTDVPVKTCLFQTALAKPSVVTLINEKEISALPNEFKTKEALTLTDAVGNRYTIPAGQELHVRRSQQESRHERRKKPTKGYFAAAWLTHGANPKKASYQFTIQVQPKAPAAPKYAVLQQNAAAHVVHFPGSYAGYCIFDPGQPLPAADILRVDKPCLIMIEEAKAKLKLTVANPDLNFALDKLPNGLNQVRSHNRYAPSRPSPVRVTLKGKWRLDGADAKTVDGEAGQTTIEFACIHGKSITISLEPSDKVRATGGRP